MKVLLAINNLTIGGAERLFVDQANKLQQDGFDVWVMTLVAETGETFRSQLNIPSEKTVQFKFKKVFDFSEFIKVNRFFKKQKFDAVVTHLFLTNFIVRIIAAWHHIKVIYSYEHNIYLRKKRTQIIADKILSKITDVIIAVSPEVANFTARQEKISLKKFLVLPNGISLDTSRISEDAKIDLKKKLKIPAGATVVATAGRLIEQKGHSYLIKAAKLIISQNPEQAVYFLIAGQGGLQAALRKEAADLGISDKIIMPGVLPINQVMSLADIFVMPSLHEGLAVVMLEAMAYGRPLVVTAVSGVAGVVDDGVNGLVVPVKDHLKLAEKISLLINDATLREKFSKTSLDRVKNFSIDKNVKIVENTLHSIYQLKKKKI